MGIGRIEMQGQVMRTQDYTSIKHHEDNRGTVEQTHVQQQIQKEDSVKLTRVQSGDQAETQHMNRHDAKEKGKNEYAGDGGRRRRQHRNEQNEDDGKVILKGIRKREEVTDQL